MEIRYKRVNALEFVARVDEYVCPPGCCLKHTVICCKALKRTARSCADSYHSAPCLFSVVNCFRCIFGNDAKLGVHIMVLDILGFNGSECTKSDMECDTAYTDTHILYLGQKLFCKVKTRCRSSCTSELFRINCLITLGVLQFFLYIRRQRHFAQSF